MQDCFNTKHITAVLLPQCSAQSFREFDVDRELGLKVGFVLDAIGHLGVTAWLRTWAEHFHRNACLVPPVDADGLLGIPWPVMPACSPVSDVRVLLATATKADATKALPMATRLLFCAQSSYWVIRLPSPGAIRCQGAKSGTVVPLFCGTPVKPSVGQAIVLCGLPTQTTPGGTVLRVNVRT